MPKPKTKKDPLPKPPAEIFSKIMQELVVLWNNNKQKYAGSFGINDLRDNRHLVDKHWPAFKALPTEEVTSTRC